MITIFFKTYGCQANVADSQGLITYLEGLGCKVATSESAADIIIINSCAVREKAEQKMFSYLGTLAEEKARRPYIRIGVIGCVASYRKQEIYDRFDHISFVFGAREETGLLHAYLVDLIVRLETTKQLFELTGVGQEADWQQDRDIKKLVAEKGLSVAQGQGCDLDDEEAGEHVENLASEAQVTLSGETGTPAADQLSLSPRERSEMKRSFINIMTGCNNYCSYCIVPFTRGREKSYSIDELVARVAHDIAAGSKEITLIGQNVNSYQDPATGANFAELLRRIAVLPGEFWVRYISPHPKDMTLDVLDTMAAYPDTLCWWVHLPLQAGSDTVLEAMKRTYSVERFMEIVQAIRDRMPTATITTDIIVGFPGETEEDFQGTMSVVNRVKFDLIYSFLYSPRKYTKAFNLGDPIPHEVKQNRFERLNARHQEICLENNSKNIGKTLRVLIEKRLAGENGIPGRLLARTSGNVRTLLDGDDSLIGTFQQVCILAAGPVNLEAKLAR